MEANTAPSQELVTFRLPPVNEVVLSVQFAGDVIDDVGTLSGYWLDVQGDFPRLEKQPPIPPVREDFQHPPAASGLQIQLMTTAPTSRYWFVSDSGSRVIQVQPNRFSLGWRQVPGGEEYPRYRRTLRPAFEQRFSAFLERVNAGENTPRPEWCELAYINHVEAHGEEPDSHGPLSQILRALNPGVTSETLPPVEDTQLQQRFVIRTSENGQPIGRLHLAATPAFRTTDSVPIYVLTLVARGKPDDVSAAGIAQFFDLAHDLIVNGFVESTRSEMHEQWGLVVPG